MITERKVTIDRSIQVIALAAQTTNEAEMKGEGVIPALWEKLHREQCLERIPNKINGKMFALYTQYLADETGPYTYAIGSEVAGESSVPEGLTCFTIPAGDYVVFTTRRGPVQQVVVEAWQYIWEWSRTNPRAFEVDFELYDDCSEDPANAQVDIYISVK
ncbi:GyrI-like domain-containing protein [Brevibacillus ginsengisoli]|uniref:GyrI-like domain-containing protein n=1 Tax=Brevibacillus ginsengisoli TaxID=363854 RepID=UPI003CEC6E66